FQTGQLRLRRSDQIDYSQFFVVIFVGKTGQMVTVMAGILPVPVKTALLPMPPETPDKSTGGSGAIVLMMHCRLHDIFQTACIPQPELADQIDFLTVDRSQVLQYLFGVVVAIH